VKKGKEIHLFAREEIERMQVASFTTRQVPTVLSYIARGESKYKWIIPNKLRQGVLAILGGESKAGKTTALYNAFQDAIVLGQCWGEFCNPVPVIHLDFETDATFIRQNMF